MQKDVLVILLTRISMLKLTLLFKELGYLGEMSEIEIINGRCL